MSTSLSLCYTAPRSDVHSQQRFFYMGHAGEVTVDQAHRGYSVSSDAAGYKSVNPLFMKVYTSSIYVYVYQCNAILILILIVHMAISTLYV